MRVSDYILRNMRVFCAVVEHSGFAGASAATGMSQAAISIHLKDLETSLGLTLCRRGRSGFQLTPKGEQAYSEIKHLLDLVDTSEIRLKNLRGFLIGNLRIGLVDSEEDNPDLSIDKAIAAFFARPNQVKLYIEMGPPQSLAKELQIGTIDAAIGPFPNKEANIHYQLLWEEKHFLYCGVQHPLFHEDEAALTPKRVMRHPVSMRPYLGNKEFAGLPHPHVMAYASDMAAQSILIQSGRFLGFLPEHFARRWIEGGRMRKICADKIKWLSPFYIATRISPEPSQVTNLFIEELVKVMQSR